MAKEIRYVTVPPTKTVKIPGLPDEEVAWVDIVRSTLLNDLRFGTGREALRMAGDIEGFIDGKQPGDVIAFPGTHHKVLCDVCKQPKLGQRGDLGFAPHIWRQIPEYLDAILDASATAPEPAPEPTPEPAQP